MIVTALCLLQGASNLVNFLFVNDHNDDVNDDCEDEGMLC